MARCMKQLKEFNYTVSSGPAKDLCGKIQTFCALIEPISPDDPKSKTTFSNIVDEWGSSSRYDQAACVLYEGSHRWMRKNTFILGRKCLLKIEKLLRHYEKFSGMSEMLFTTASGWILQEVSFTLDGAEPLEQILSASSHSVHEGVS